MVGRHASRHVALAFTFHPPNIDKVPEGRETSELLGERERVDDEEACSLHGGTWQTQLLPRLLRRRHTTPWCCHRPSGGSEERADVAGVGKGVGKRDECERRPVRGLT